MLDEPFRGERCDPFESTGLRKQMRCAGYDFESRLTGQLRERLTVERQHIAVVAADDEKRRGAYLRERSARKVRAPAA